MGSGQRPSRFWVSVLVVDYGMILGLIEFSDLAALKRHPALQKRYDAWIGQVKEAHGSVGKPSTQHICYYVRILILPTVNFLVNIRLGWGPTPSRPISPSQHTEPTFASTNPNVGANGLEPPQSVVVRPLTPSTRGDKEWFTADIGDALVKILPNDWPYSGMRYLTSLNP